MKFTGSIFNEVLRMLVQIFGLKVFIFKIISSKIWWISNACKNNCQMQRIWTFKQQVSTRV